MSNGKVVHAFMLEHKGEWPGFFLKQHFIEMEYPPKSGKKIKIPEIDKADFFNLEKAKKKIHHYQIPFIERFVEIVNKK